MPSTRIRLNVYWIPFIVFAVVLASDFVLERWVEGSGILVDSVDLHSPSVLYSKALFLKNAPGKKIVMIGDSNVAGGVSQEFGEADWRSHTLSRELQRQLQTAGVDRPQVMNLAMNAAQALETRKVTEAILTARPDVLLIEMHIYIFVAKDKGPAIHYNRPWLKDAKITEDGWLDHATSPNETWFQRFDDLADSFFLRHWYAYRVRDFLQWRFLSGPPSEGLQRGMIAGDNLLGIHPPVNIWGGGDAKRNISKAKADIPFIKIEESNEQVKALRANLQHLNEIKQKTIIFYEPESPEVMKTMVSPEEYQRLRGEIRKIIDPYQSATLKIVWDAEAPPKDGYWDFAHLKGSASEFFIGKNLLNPVLDLLKD